MTMICVRRLAWLLSCLIATLLPGTSAAQTAPPAAATLPSETPAKVEPATGSFDYVKREVMIAMRDGAKLHTVIVIPKGAKNAPILPMANHVFLRGHRIMVQIQSSWFPLYDRNPQTFIPNIFWAKPGDYQKAVQRIFHAPDQASFVELPVVETH